MKNIKNQLLWFLIPTFIITWGLGLAAYLNGGLSAFPLSRLSMFIPGVVVILLYLLVLKLPLFRNNDIGLRLGNWKWYFMVPLLMSLLVGLTYVLPYALDSSLFLSHDEIVEATRDSGFGFGHIVLNLGAIFSLNIFLAPIINIMMMLGEELGWRAYMMPRLLKLTFPSKAFLIGGAAWALWHAPGILMGYNYPSQPVFGVFIFILVCVPLGVILQYIYYKTGSVIITAIAHGAINWTASTFSSFILHKDIYNTLIHGPTGMYGIVILSAVACMLYKSMDWNKEVLHMDNTTFSFLSIPNKTISS